MQSKLRKRSSAVSRNIKLTLQYDGAYFFGFQKQKRKRTVQAELARAFQKLFQKRVKFSYASRTDSGVHAEAQVVNFLIQSKIPREKILLGLNRYLPADLSVIQIEEVPLDFHAQFSARWKLYEYRILNARARQPLERLRSSKIFEPLDLALMRRAARVFIGTHDFRAFQASGSERKSTVRTIRKFTVSRQEKIVVFQIEANGFLYKMARRLIGAVVHAGRGKISPKELASRFRKKEQVFFGETMPPQGLTLKKVVY